jgi:Spy/CpxP family protein refolding chaperone
MNVRLRALTLLAAVFLMGCLVSGGLFYVWSSRFIARDSGPFLGPPSPQNWTEALKLSPRQEEQFREIMSESRLKIDAVMQENGPKMEAIRAEMNRKLIAILNDGQKKEFQELVRRFEERMPSWKQDHPRNPPPF